jgi:hypothetical protein
VLHSHAKPTQHALSDLCGAGITLHCAQQQIPTLTKAKLLKSCIATSTSAAKQSFTTSKAASKLGSKTDTCPQISASHAAQLRSTPPIAVLQQTQTQTCCIKPAHEEANWL